MRGGGVFSTETDKEEVLNRPRPTVLEGGTGVSCSGPSYGHK